MAETAEHSTKMQILRLLKTKGGLEAKGIAEACGLTTMGVRRHLLGLRAAGLIQVKTERRPRGRPTTVHSLTESGDAGFPRDYEGLAFDVLASLRVLDGESKVLQVFRRRREEMKTRFLPRMKGKSLEQRVREMAAILTERGYMAAVSPAGRGCFLLTGRNCALPRVARSFPVACDEELGLIRGLVGASVSRVRHLLAGDLQCSYLIQPRGTELPESRLSTTTRPEVADLPAASDLDQAGSVARPEPAKRTQHRARRRR